MNLQKVIEKLQSQLSLLGQPDPQTPEWVEAQALFLGLSFLKTAQALNIQTPVELNSLRREIRTQLVEAVPARQDSP